MNSAEHDFLLTLTRLHIVVVLKLWSFIDEETIIKLMFLPDDPREADYLGEDDYLEEELPPGISNTFATSKANNVLAGDTNNIEIYIQRTPY
jgi:hypothetical protein